MQRPTVVAIPPVRSVVRHALPYVLEGSVIPLVVFLAVYRLGGVRWAILAGFSWSAAAIVRRIRTSGEVPGLLLLSSVGLTAKTGISLATGSAFVYFLQPTIGTALVGVTFAASVAVHRPLAERVTRDLCPLEPEVLAHPAVRRFFRRASLVWAMVNFVNASIALWLLCTQPLATVIVVRSVMGPTFLATTVVACVLWFRSSMADHGIAVRWATPDPVLVA